MNDTDDGSTSERDSAVDRDDSFITDAPVSDDAIIGE